MSEWKTKCSTQKHFSKDILRKNEITEKQGGKFKWCDPKQRFFFFLKNPLERIAHQIGGGRIWGDLSPRDHLGGGGSNT